VDLVREILLYIAQESCAFHLSSTVRISACTGDVLGRKISRLPTILLKRIPRTIRSRLHLTGAPLVACD
jgi:hypothetical protein